MANNQWDLTENTRPAVNKDKGKVSARRAPSCFDGGV